jgi:ribosomal protein S12 methylthiotransferase
MSAKIGFIALGCPKATVDAERILSRLRAEEYEISPNYDDVALVIVNTCGFIDAAVEESFQAIDEALRKNGKVIVSGCLGAEAERIRARYPHVLAVTGPAALEEVMHAVHLHIPPQHEPYVHLLPPGGIKLTPRHYAYLKIAEGCNQRCTFCVIPTMRGVLHSRPVGDILTEAEKLVEAGVKELLIVAQDTAAYGVDIKYRSGFWRGTPVKSRITDLARALGQLGVWIRLHYVYPYPHIDELVDLMADGVILPYLDVPLQHASSRILKSMKRPADSENMLRRIETWRKRCPELVLRSTFIVGFPGESGRDFEDLLEFLEAAQLDRVGAFMYSPVQGAAANALRNYLPRVFSCHKNSISLKL